MVPVRLPDHLARGDVIFAYGEAPLFVLQLLYFAHGGGEAWVLLGVVLFGVRGLPRRGLLKLLAAVARQRFNSQVHLVLKLLHSLI